MMATDDATLNAGDKKKTQPIKGTQEKKLKGNLKFVTGQKERFMKNWLALGVFFFVFSKKKICCSCSICHLLPGSLNVLFQRETYGWWEKVKAEEKQNRSRIRDLHVCSFEIIKAKYRLTWTTHTFPLSEFEYFEKKILLFFPDTYSNGNVTRCSHVLGPFPWLWLYMMWPSINFNATKIKYFECLVSCFNLS